MRVALTAGHLYVEMNENNISFPKHSTFFDFFIPKSIQYIVNNEKRFIEQYNRCFSKIVIDRP